MGSPRSMAMVAAREKFWTEVAEITVEAKHRENALSSKDSGAALVGEEGSNRAP